MSWPNGAPIPDGHEADALKFGEAAGGFPGLRDGSGRLAFHVSPTSTEPLVTIPTGRLPQLVALLVAAKAFHDWMAPSPASRAVHLGLPELAELQRAAMALWAPSTTGGEPTG